MNFGHTNYLCTMMHIHHHCTKSILCHSPLPAYDLIASWGAFFYLFIFFCIEISGKVSACSLNLKIIKASQCDIYQIW